MACRIWLPVGEEPVKMLSSRLAQCEGIWRPPEAGSEAAPTACRNMASGVTPRARAEGAVAIVGEEPVVAGAQVGGGGHQQGFVSGAGDLEVDFLLALEQDFAVVDAPREHHQPVHLHQLLRSQSLVGLFTIEAAGSPCMAFDDILVPR